LLYSLFSFIVVPVVLVLLLYSLFSFIVVLLFLFYCCIRCSCSLWHLLFLFVLLYLWFLFIVVHCLPFIVVFVVLVPLAPFLPFIVVFFLGDLLYKTIGYALILVRFICFKHQHESIETCNPDTRCFLGIDVVDIKWLLISYLFTLAWTGVHNYLVIIYV
jgi:hypothetical protein